MIENQTTKRHRKTHQKSRFGCLSCKKRHLKCGEERPSCGNCTRRETECIYDTSKPTHHAPSSGASSTGDAHPTPEQADQGACFPHLSRLSSESAIRVTRLEEMQLIVHYLNSTYETMSQGDDLIVWKKAIPEEAVRFDFLMDGLLSLSSLHLASDSLDSRHKYIGIAMQYQNSGIRNYIATLGNITSENSHALFAYAVITVILTLAFLVVQDEPGELVSIQSLTLMFELLQGVDAINYASGGTLKDGAFKPLFLEFPSEAEPLSADTDVIEALAKLRARARHIARYLEPDRLEVYISGVDQLELAFAGLTTSRYLGPIVAWPAMISNRLLDFFKRDDPMAQLIFLHYGVLLLHANDRWWGRHLGLRFLNDLLVSISSQDAEWYSCTEWVRQQIQ